jgi:pimeloyl-ACP methyl ester carboxylesterase
MGRSGKSPAKAYRFIAQARYLDAWFEALDLTSNVILVLHDWGSALGFYRAFRHMLPKSVLRQVSERELDAYRAPFLDREALLPMLIWRRAGILPGMAKSAGGRGARHSLHPGRFSARDRDGAGGVCTGVQIPLSSPMSTVSDVQ